ncbi:MAG TPA: S-layer homology domain-containing protein [Candidatus Flavonifractor merdigallinarum]|uniref:S-layer homology domain-containing protein n=1 Tax=Candidatus Flavonifractor merdigallinarum TaxID=2838589 RepID=A0A9D1Y7K7_9FIRM|nr:S-layer homology domain-containing protein [Candidatus Flavonifractor merdigallinarum]
MKGKRILATALALTTALTLLTGPVSAAAFTDLNGHWAQKDVEYLSALGLVKGYDDGSFKPDANMSAVEALLFCARVNTLNTNTKAAIVSKWASELKSIIGADMYSWAATDLSVCLETGIITPEELSALSRGGGLLNAIPREEVTRYLARAMQLAPVAEGLSSYTLNYTDKDSISQNMQPYVYLLSLYGILKGDEFNRFNPKDPLNRASMTSLLRRAMDFMAQQGIVVELPNYTSYDWVGGVITNVNVTSSGATQLTLETVFSGSKTVILSSNVTIYESNMRSDGTALKPGLYARANLNGSGLASEVRVGGELERFSGTVSALSDQKITVTSGGVSRTFPMDRFTQVKVGSKVGGVELLDLNAGYTGAVCSVDALGHLAAVELTGGTRQETGLLSSVEIGVLGSGRIQLSGMDGVKNRYDIPSDAVITVNGASGKLTTSQVGDYVTLRISNDGDERVTAVNVDTTQQYIQASIKGVTTSQSPSKITVTDLNTNRSATYTIAGGCDIRYEDETIGMSRLEKGWYATLKLTGSEVTEIHAYPGSTYERGTISSITYGIPTLLTITREDGTTASFELDLSAPPDIYRNGTRTTIDRLKNGDQVQLTVRYQKVSAIEAQAQSANASGTISSVTMDTQGTSITVALTGGGSATYLVREGVSVTQNGKAVAISSLKPGYQISMVVDGDQVLSIEVDKNAQSSNQLTGTVLYVNTSNREILLQTTDSSGVTNAITVNVSSAELRSAAGGALSIGNLAIGNQVLVFGAYDGLTFQATLLIRT